MQSPRIARRRVLRGSRTAAFTLVEVLVVLAILTLLFSLVAVQLDSARDEAAEKATIATLLRLEQYLDRYREITGHYPPDGVDAPVYDDDGHPIRGSACLYSFLSRPVVVSRIVGGQVQVRELPPVGKLRAEELTPKDPERPGVREIVDGWGTPIHYDHTEDGVFRSQDGSVHLERIEEGAHPPDPRGRANPAWGISRAGLQGKGFDLWTHGRDGHENVARERSRPIASWNIER